MKKFFAVVLTAVLGISALFAGDVEDVKAVLVKDMELGAQGKFIEMLALRTPDYVEVDKHGTFNYEHFKWSILMLDGEHPEEFVLTVWALHTRGTEARPTAEQMAKIRELAGNPEFVKSYRESIPKIVSGLKDDQALQLKTTKFVSVDIDGDTATAVAEYDTKSPNGVTHKIGTAILRKVNGAWKIRKVVSKAVQKE